MKVMLGWSGETEKNVWRKTDVTLDEADLGRILREADVPPEVAGKLSTRLAYKLLDNESEIHLTRKLVGFGYPGEAAKARIKLLEEQNTIILGELRSRATTA